MYQNYIDYVLTSPKQELDDGMEALRNVATYSVIMPRELILKQVSCRTPAMDLFPHFN